MSRNKSPDNAIFSRTYNLFRPAVLLFVLALLSLRIPINTEAFAQTTIPPTPFIDLEYSYDGVGNVTAILDNLDPNNNRSMQYDSLDRLIDASGLWGPGSFSYDAIGNRINKSIDATNKNYSYGSSDNRLSGYPHDANGNVLQDDTFSYEYDSENRLVRATNGTDVITYQYDGDGRRISKTVNGETTYYAYGIGPNVLTEFNSQGVPKHDYIYAGNKNVARINYGQNGVKQGTSFYHTDHLGSSLAMTDESTTVVWNQTYLPFGETYKGTSSVTNTHQYTGKEYEAETGLYYYGSRYYHPGLGRFMSVDPAPGVITDPQSWNRYAYTLNNPYKYVDPDGELAVKFNFQETIESNNRIRSNLNFIPNFILNMLFPVDPESIAMGFLPGPQALGAVVVSKATGKALLTKAKVSNPVSSRVARVIPLKHINAPTLAHPSLDDAFVTAADDIAGIANSSDLARRLTLFDESGELVKGPFGILEFDTPANIASPISRSNSGFVGQGLTQGEAREFVIPNLRREQLQNLTTKVVP